MVNNISDLNLTWWQKEDLEELNEKYPDGIEGQKLKLEMEGHIIIKKGKKYFIENYEEKIFKLNTFN